jgi:NADH dehydrogenase
VPHRAVVTGAFGYIGSAVARELRRRGFVVHTLTNRRAPAGAGAITSAPLLFDRAHLERELAGADVFVNTFWIRLPHAGQDFGSAVERSLLLVEAARAARVGRFVHVSVSNASPGSRLGYFAGKAAVDEAVRGSGLSHAIVRPTLVVGPSDVLTSNIAWLLRRLPFFLLPGGGRCRLQPVTLDDTGRIVADAAEAQDDLDVDAAGPTILSFGDYVRLVARAVGVRRPLIPAPGGVALAALRAVGPLLGDEVLVREELEALEQELLVSRAPPLGRESVEAWLLANGAALGLRYVNDRRRHFGAGRTTPVLTP